MSHLPLAWIATIFVISATSLLGGCSADSNAGTGDPAFEGAFGGKGDAIGEGRLRVAGGAAQLLSGGDRADNQRISWDLPDDGVEMTGMWTRPDYGIPAGSYTEIAAYRIGKPAGSFLVLETSSAKLSLFLRKVGKAHGAAMDGGRLIIEDAEEGEYGLLVGPSGRQHGQRSLGFDLETSLLPAAPPQTSAEE